ncbi:hypothetical protein C1Y41_04730 [Pantoea sp. ICBG 1758]|nr:hypothetical protein C1Y41_04730 [Pantoea sp. ICBG 1758]
MSKEPDLIIDNKIERNQFSTRNEFEKIIKRKKLNSFAFRFSKGKTDKRMTSESFHDFWIERGWGIRRSVKNDRNLAKILRRLMPKIQHSARWVYRGESLDDFKKGKVGFCWTEKKEVAYKFAKYVNNSGSGGILLKAFASSEAILAGLHPRNESSVLQEFEITVNPFMLDEIEIIEVYPHEVE